VLRGCNNGLRYGWDCEETDRGGINSACSARSGRRNRGPAFELSPEALCFGRAHDVAHQRDAYFGISHILAQPLRALETAQWQ
jgi:hypothetical protein